MNASPSLVVARVALFGLAVVVSRKRPAMRPVVLALAVMAALDGARLLPLPAALDRTAWLAWAGVSPSLSWRVWRGKWLPFFTLAGWLGFAPWEAHPEAWHVARWVPYLVAPGVSLWAWWGKSPGVDRGASWCAATLAWSGLVDVAVGALARRPYNLTAAHVVSVATWIVLAGILVRAYRRP